MPSTRRHSYDLNFKLKIVAEAEAVNNNREIAHEYGISHENAGFCTHLEKLYFVARKYSVIRHTPSFEQILIKQAYFLVKNGAPYK